MRWSAQFILFLIFFNGGASVMIPGAGWDANLGIDPHVGEPQELEQVNQTASDFETGSGIGQTLFGLYNAVAGTLESMFNAIFPGGAMLKNAGVPDYIVNYGFSAATVLAAWDLIGVLREGNWP